MSGIKCCYKCENRTPTCHGTCKTYISEKAEYDRLKAEEKKNRPPLICYGDFTGDSALHKGKLNKHKRR